jgi:hypothetical protein
VYAYAFVFFCWCRVRFISDMLIIDPPVPVIICSHAPAGYMAAVTAGIFVLCLPVLLVWVLLSDTWLSSARRSLDVDQNQKRGFRGGASRVAPEDLAAVVLRTNSSCSPDPAVAPFISCYSPGAWAFALVDVGTVVIVGVLEGLYPRPDTLTLQVRA